MPTRPCLDCGTLTKRKDGRCEAHAREWNRRRDAVRGNTTQRSYGAAHQAVRARLLPLAIGTPCPRCGDTMHIDQQLDLGHSTRERKLAGLPGDRIEHSVCNRADR